MTAAEALAEAFEVQRPHLLRVAYGQLGSRAEAEDVVQEAWLRLERAGADDIRDLRAWLTTTVNRLALDTLRSARVRRERYVGPWLPEPVVDADPADRVTLDESIGTALLVVLETLSPGERVAFVMHDVFGYDFAAVAEVLGTTPEAARQQASRGRRRVRDGRPRFPATREQQQRIVAAFLLAAAEGDADALVALLHPDAVMRADGGGVVNAPRKPIEGAGRVARTTIALARHGGDAAGARIVDVNGMPGVIFHGADGIPGVVSFTVDDGRITAIDVVRNPDKLRELPSSVLRAAPTSRADERGGGAPGER
ncbi:MAG: polymerase sigma-70 factor, subfamily [Solirubrobacteraceae bacterium]|nr:polymerase sigma-70 factor, subfamily [Solirubrobacteraceae bacterium]